MADRERTSYTATWGGSYSLMVLNKSLKTKLDSVNRLEINYRLSALPKNLVGSVVRAG